MIIRSMILLHDPICIKSHVVRLMMKRSSPRLALQWHQILIMVIKTWTGYRWASSVMGYFRNTNISILYTRPLVVNRVRGLFCPCFQGFSRPITAEYWSVVQVLLLQPFPCWIKHDAIRLLGSVSRWSCINTQVINGDVQRGCCYCRGFRYENRWNTYMTCM